MRLVESSGFTKVSALGVEEKRVDVVIDLVTPLVGRAGFADGFRVETRIVVWEAEDVVQVPTGALFRRGERWVCFVVEEGRAQLRPIDVAARTPRQVAVASGLSEGEQVSPTRATRFAMLRAWSFVRAADDDGWAHRQGLDATANR